MKKLLKQLRFILRMLKSKENKYYKYACIGRSPFTERSAIIATDGYRLISVDLDDVEIDKEILVSDAVLEELIKELGKNEEIEFSKYHSVEGTFPDVRVVIPEFALEFTINRKEIMDLIGNLNYEFKKEHVRRYGVSYSDLREEIDYDYYLEILKKARNGDMHAIEYLANLWDEYDDILKCNMYENVYIFLQGEEDIKIGIGHEEGVEVKRAFLKKNLGEFRFKFTPKFIKDCFDVMDNDVITVKLPWSFNPVLFHTERIYYLVMPWEDPTPVKSISKHSKTHPHQTWREKVL